MLLFLNHPLFCSIHNTTSCFIFFDNHVFFLLPVGNHPAYCLLNKTLLLLIFISRTATPELLLIGLDGHRHGNRGTRNTVQGVISRPV